MSNQQQQPTDDPITQALSLIEQIDDLVEDLPEAGQEFGDSVSDKANDIHSYIERHQRVTPAQIAALENMLDGLRRWLHN